MAILAHGFIYHLFLSEKRNSNEYINKTVLFDLSRTNSLKASAGYYTSINLTCTAEGFIPSFMRNIE